jgi:hypothetical protein
MRAEILRALQSEEFTASVGFLLPTPALHQVLSRSPLVRDITKALAAGELTEDAIREFVESLMSDLQQGQHLPHDLALAALAVSLEHHPGPFAEEFLHSLSQLKLAEMSVSIRIANECRRHRLEIRNQTTSPEVAPGPARVEVS